MTPIFAPKPQIGRIVLYRSRTGAYTVPAMITATVDTLNPKGVEAGHIPALSSPWHVHLTVFSPGFPQMRGDADDFQVRSEHPVSENVSGCYQEWNIPPTALVLNGDADQTPQRVVSTSPVGARLRAFRDALAPIERDAAQFSAADAIGVLPLPADVSGDDPYALTAFQPGTYAFPLIAPGPPFYGSPEFLTDPARGGDA